MIQFKNFDFYYSSKNYLYKDLNMTLESGKIYGLFGKNGIGKTTLLKAMVGLSYPKDGTLTVGDYQPKDRNPFFLNQIFYVPDEFELPKLQVKTYVSVFKGYYPNFSEVSFCEYLKLFRLDESQKLHKFSFGQQKKFLIAFALACNTQYIFMDEPTNGLDIPSKIEFRKMLVSVMTEDKTIVISTHQAKDLEQMIDHVLILDDAGLVVDSSMSQVAQKLAFNFYQQKPIHQICLNVQSVVNGYWVLEENIDGDETVVGLEQLMVAAIENSERIQTIFKS